MKKNHTCQIDGGECVKGSVYMHGEVRVARPLCNCSCHLKPGEKKRDGSKK